MLVACGKCFTVYSRLGELAWLNYNSGRGCPCRLAFLQHVKNDFDLISLVSIHYES